MYLDRRHRMGKSYWSEADDDEDKVIHKTGK
jgi:hypothetical protein